MLLLKMISAILFATLVQHVDGNQKVVIVNELINEDNFTSTSGDGDNSLTCCLYGNCSCHSFDHALANLTSNVLINITTDVMLSSIIEASDLENVSIIGHNNPTVNCKEIGGIHFTFCCNCFIQGITWDGCGTNNTEPGLKLNYSSNITIQSCSFQHSIGQAVVLSEVSGDVSINYCVFVNNSQYKGHDAAIHFSSNYTTNYSQLLFVLNNSNFAHNKHAKSILYVGETKRSKVEHISICNSTFHGNQGVSVYAVNQSLHLNGKVLFQNNKAEIGAGIHINDHSTVIFGKNSDVAFTHNSASSKGGAVFLRNHSTILFHNNSIVAFNDNSATNGGTIYSEANSNVKFTATCQVTFNNNSAIECGAVIYSSDSSHITFTGDAIVTFINNVINNVIYNIDFQYFGGLLYPYRGGTIYSEINSYISFGANSITLFSNNNVARNSGGIDTHPVVFYGGAILSVFNSHISFIENSNTTFSDNKAIKGGAIRLYGSNITIKDYSRVLFSNNTAQSYGGAFYITSSFVTIKGNSIATFNNNEATVYGGVMYCEFMAGVIFKENSTSMFNKNKATHGGTVRLHDRSKVTIKEYSRVTFSNNIAPVLHLKYNCDIIFKENSTVKFINNIASDSERAVYAEDYSDITFDDNSTVTFTNDKVTFGTSVYSYGNSKIMVKGKSVVMFNNLLPKWCNNVCLPYTGQGDVITIDSTGIISCSNRSAFICLIEKCHCNHFSSYFIYHHPLITNTDRLVLSSVIFLEGRNHLSFIGHNNLTVNCVNGGRLYIIESNNIMIKGINWIGCGGNSKPGIQILDSYDIEIQNCIFQHSLHQAVTLHYQMWFSGTVNINHCKFVNNNRYKAHGSAIDYSTLTNSPRFNITIIINNCKFSYNEVAMSLVYIGSPFAKLELNNSGFYNNQGVSVYLQTIADLSVNGEVIFENNLAVNGAGIYVYDNSTVIFGKNSNVKFINNSVYQNGAAIFLSSYSSVSFDQNSIVTFNDNNAINGNVYSAASSNVIFKGTSQVTFSNNSVTRYGAAIYSSDNSHVAFVGSSKVTFISNVGHTNDRYLQLGGIIYSENYGSISFEGNSTTVFKNNTADNGAAIFSLNSSSVTFKDKSKVMFSNNTVQYCGVLISGGTFLCNNCTVTIKDYSNVTFKGNNASQSGGAIYLYNMSKITFKDNSSSTFINNIAKDNGGAIFCGQQSEFTCKGKSTVAFAYNTADNGGTFYLTKCTIKFKGSSMVSFDNNVARRKGGVGYFINSEVRFEETATVKFNNNMAEQDGGVLYSIKNKILFKGDTTITLTSNTATLKCGALYFGYNSDVSLSEFTNITLNNNRALYGGAVLVTNHANISLTGNSVSLFVNNEAAQSGGAWYFDSHCNFIMEENARVTFVNNKALNGGAACFNNNTNIFKGNSTLFFYNNLATVGGGAVNILNATSIILKDYTNVNFTNNRAQYGAAIFLDITAVTINKGDNNSILSFKGNIAKISGNSVYKDVAKLCNGSCLNNRIEGINNKIIATPPNELMLYNPAICIDNDNDTHCNNYYVQDIMLGREIVISACVLDYYNQSINSTQFLVQSEMNQSYFITGPKQILISCDKFQGISIMGNQILSTSTNFSITITLNVDHNADWKQISVSLIVELSLCHPGFWQYSNSQECKCYNAYDIVFCSGSNSTIKRGYWFGNVTGKPTVTFCPINYCNFTCCETSNGYYHLSPVRDNQCRSHRSGTACGSCKDGYTLSFDSTECVNVEGCTAGQTVLVILLTVIYWIVMIALVFAMMYYKVGIGYLYSITYYYSILDILLSQNMQASRELYITVNIISSFSKITPQFLGELCLIPKMSGIDQQFIHYTHPSAVVLILILISVIARSSRRFSAIISRGIIRVICLLLLLSYTSMASTSLLLMRSLTFHEIDKVYTYLSPDIEYFHGRHLVYGIVALLCTVSIVIGLPLLLTFEPFLNHKINFIKIKPLLDQFQGCYKDKFHCFAGYYMICRLLIITIVIANSSNDFVASYMLVIVCVIIALIHLTVKPYNNEILNKFDGMILHLIVLITALPLFDDFESPLVITIAFLLVILPLVNFIAMTFFLHKDDLKKIVTHFTTKNQSPSSNTNDVNNEIAMREFDLIIDNNMRQNATICDV